MSTQTDRRSGARQCNSKDSRETYRQTDSETAGTAERPTDRQTDSETAGTPERPTDRQTDSATAGTPERPVTTQQLGAAPWCVSLSTQTDMCSGARQCDTSDSRETCNDTETWCCPVVCQFEYTDRQTLWSQAVQQQGLHRDQQTDRQTVREQGLQRDL